MTEAQFLGVAYENGRGAEYAKAVKWYKKAAEQGDADAQYNLGVAYYKGERVIKNHTKAFELFKKAAEQGHASSQYNLGVAYKNGREVIKSYSNSYVYFLTAQALGAEQEGISSLIAELENTYLSKEEVINAQNCRREIRKDTI